MRLYRICIYNCLHYCTYVYIRAIESAQYWKKHCYRRCITITITIENSLSYISINVMLWLHECELLAWPRFLTVCPVCPLMLCRLSNSGAFSPWCLSITRGNNYKLLNHTFHYDLRKHFFTARIVNIWNSLPNSVVDANSVNSFKARLDKFWLHQEVTFDFTADLSGTRNRSVLS